MGGQHAHTECNEFIQVINSGSFLVGWQMWNCAYELHQFLGSSFFALVLLLAVNRDFPIQVSTEVARRVCLTAVSLVSLLK